MQRLENIDRYCHAEKLYSLTGEKSCVKILTVEFES